MSNWCRADADSHAQGEVEMRRGPEHIGWIAEPVGRHIARLEPDAGIIVDEAASGADVFVAISLCQIGQPFRLGHRVIVDETHDVARRHGDADVARHRQNPLRTMRHLNPGPERSKVLHASRRASGRRPRRPRNPGRSR